MKSYVSVKNKTGGICNRVMRESLPDKEDSKHDAFQNRSEIPGSRKDCPGTGNNAFG